MIKALGGRLLGGKHSDHRMSVAQLLRARRLCPQTAGSRPRCPHPRAPAHCQSMGPRKKVRPREVLPQVRPGRKYTGLAVVLSNPALVFPLTASLPENAASSGWALRAAVSPLDGQTDGQTAWAGVRLCGSDALCTCPPRPQGPVRDSSVSVAPFSPVGCAGHTGGSRRECALTPWERGLEGLFGAILFLLLALPMSRFISFALTCSHRAKY